MSELPNHGCSRCTDVQKPLKIAEKVQYFINISYETKLMVCDFITAFAKEIYVIL